MKAYVTEPGPKLVLRVRPGLTPFGGVSVATPKPKRGMFTQKQVL